MSSDERVDRLQQLLERVRASASERGIALPRDLPEGTLAEHLRRKSLGLGGEDIIETSEPEFEAPEYVEYDAAEQADGEAEEAEHDALAEGAPAEGVLAEDALEDAPEYERSNPETSEHEGGLAMVESTKSERVLTAFPDGETRADQPLALVPPPMVRPAPTRSEYTSLPSGAERHLEKPALVQFSGHFDEEETSTGDASAIEALALEEERLARAKEEEEIVASGLLDDGTVVLRVSARDLEQSALDDEEAIDIDDDVEILESDPPDERPEPASAADSEEEEDVAGTDPPSSSEEARAPIWGGQPPSDDFERAVVRFASSAPRAPAAPLELEDLDDLNVSAPQPSQAAVSSAALFDVADLGAIERAHEEESDVRHLEQRAEPSPKSSPRPVAFDGERDGDLAMDSEPPESGEVESQPYPKSVRQTSEPELHHDPYAAHGVIDDGLSEPPPTMHTLPGYDDEPTPRPVQVATTEVRSLGAVDVRDRARLGAVEAVAVFEPRREPAPTHFGAILDLALSLLKP